MITSMRSAHPMDDMTVSNSIQFGSKPPHCWNCLPSKCVSCRRLPNQATRSGFGLLNHYKSVPNYPCRGQNFPFSVMVQAIGTMASLLMKQQRANIVIGDVKPFKYRLSHYVQQRIEGRLYHCSWTHTHWRLGKTPRPTRCTLRETWPMLLFASYFCAQQTVDGRPPTSPLNDRISPPLHTNRLMEIGIVPPLDVNIWQRVYSPPRKPLTRLSVQRFLFDHAVRIPGTYSTRNNMQTIACLPALAVSRSNHAAIRPAARGYVGT